MTMTKTPEQAAADYLKSTGKPEGAALARWIESGAPEAICRFFDEERNRGVSKEDIALTWYKAVAILTHTVLGSSTENPASRELVNAAADLIAIRIRRFGEALLEQRRHSTSLSPHHHERKHHGLG